MGPGGKSSSIGGHSGATGVQFVHEQFQGVRESQVGKPWESHVKIPAINSAMAAFTG